MVDENDWHGARVAAWLESEARGLPPARLLDLFERACAALWSRARPALGDAALAAIVARVAGDAAERCPSFAALRVGEGGVDLGPMRARLGDAPPGELAAGVALVLAGFLAVVGHLTADVLTPALHAAVAAVTLGDGPPAVARARRPASDATPPGRARPAAAAGPDAPPARERPARRPKAGDGGTTLRAGAGARDETFGESKRGERW